jgi:hypothetical protein
MKCSGRRFKGRIDYFCGITDVRTTSPELKCSHVETQIVRLRGYDRSAIAMLSRPVSDVTIRHVTEGPSQGFSPGQHADAVAARRGE